MKKNLLIGFYIIFLAVVVSFLYVTFIYQADSNEIKIIKNIYTKLEKEIPDIAELRSEGRKVAFAVASENAKHSISSLFTSNYEIETVYKEKNTKQGNYDLCLNRYIIYNNEKVYAEKCHDLNTIESFNKKKMFKLVEHSNNKIIYEYTTKYTKDKEVVFTDYQVELSYIDNTWKISNGVLPIINKDKNMEYFVYIDNE